MKCVICKRSIRPKETRSYHWLGKRKVFACSEHNGDPFSEWIDKQYKNLAELLAQQTERTI